MVVLLTLAILSVTFAIAVLAASEVADINPYGFHRGILIDAGSGGSRLHIYTWKSRVFETLPPPISYPSSDEKWTDRMAPGVSSFVNDPEKVPTHLIPLIEFAKKTLLSNEKDWGNYPIYFKATGGMREAPLEQRELIMMHVRAFLSDKTQCPFYFHQDFARVMSGEEEAIYAWTGVNFLMGTLLDSTYGSGAADPDVDTYGVIDLGGASTQIAFFVPSQDVSEGLFKLQIGGQKHWNVYAKTFLGFGHVSARQRHLQLVIQAVIPENEKIPTPKKRSVPLLSAVDYCFYAGYEEIVTYDTSNPHLIHSSSALLSALDGVSVTVRGPAKGSKSQLEQCMNSLKPLLWRENGAYCSWIHDGQCSIGGQYQPALPTGGHFKFIGTSSYRYAWSFLMMPPTATLFEFRKRAINICSMTYKEIANYADINHLNIDQSTHMVEFLPYFCFMASYNLVLLIDGYGFKLDQSITVLDAVNGNKVGWALGCMLYEINTLPWTFNFHRWVITNYSSYPYIIGSVGFLLGLIISYVWAHYQLTEKVLVCYHYHIQGTPFRHQYELIPTSADEANNNRYLNSDVPVTNHSRSSSVNGTTGTGYGTGTGNSPSERSPLFETPRTPTRNGNTIV